MNTRAAHMIIRRHPQKRQESWQMLQEYMQDEDAARRKYGMVLSVALQGWADAEKRYLSACYHLSSLGLLD